MSLNNGSRERGSAVGADLSATAHRVMSQINLLLLAIFLGATFSRAAQTAAISQLETYITGYPVPPE